MEAGLGGGVGVGREALSMGAVLRRLQLGCKDTKLAVSGTNTDTNTRMMCMLTQTRPHSKQTYLQTRARPHTPKYARFDIISSTFTVTSYHP